MIEILIVSFWLQHTTSDLATKDDRREAQLRILPNIKPLTVKMRICAYVYFYMRFLADLYLDYFSRKYLQYLRSSYRQALKYELN